MKRILIIVLTLLIATSMLLSASCTCQMVDDRVEIGCYGDLIPCANVTYDIGSADVFWDNIYAEHCFCGDISGNFTGNVTSVVCATLVVAASNSLDASRADYQCDGTADDVQINAAIAALPLVGGRIVLLEGDYATAANIVMSGNSTLQGQGMSTEITANGNAVSNAIVINDDGVHVRDMKITIGVGCGVGGVRPNVIYANGRSRLLLENLYLSGDRTVGSDGSVSRQNGIFFSNVDYSRVLNCEATDNEYFGIRLQGSSDYNNIGHSIFYDNGKDGLILDTSDNNNVLSCICNSNTEYGLHLKSADNNFVEGNTCALNTRAGIYTLASFENNYINNILLRNVTYGLELLGGDYSVVDGNSAIGNDSGATNTYSGLYISANNTAITGNACYDNGLHGIRLYRASHCTIDSNVCGQQVAGDGIHVFGDATTFSNDNTITGNSCYGNGDDGIEIVGAANAYENILCGNSLKDNIGTNLVDGGTGTEYCVTETTTRCDIMGDLYVGYDLDVGDDLDVTDYATIDKLQVGTNVPPFPLRSGMAFVSESLRVEGYSIFRTQHEGFGIWSSGHNAYDPLFTATGSFDIVGGVQDNLWTATTPVFSIDNEGDMLLIMAGTHHGATADIEEFIDASNVVLHPFNWQVDIANSEFAVFGHPIFIAGAGGHVHVDTKSEGDFLIHSDNHTGECIVCITGDAGEDDADVLDIGVDAHGFIGAQAIDIDYYTGNVTAGDELGVVKIALDESGASSNSTSSYFDLLQLFTTDVYAGEKTAIHVGTAFDIALEVSGATAEDPDLGYEVTAADVPTDRVTGIAPAGTAFLESSASDLDIFDADNDYILIGDTAKFNEVDCILINGSNRDIKEDYYYSTGVGTWSALMGTNTLNGWQNSGIIAFEPPSDWALTNAVVPAGAAITNGYYIKVVRTQNSVGTVPNENYFKLYPTGDTGMLIRGDGTIKPPHIADANAQNDSIYYSTTQGKLVYRDSTGAVHVLY